MAHAALDKLAEDICILNVSQKTIITDFFVIMTGKTNRHIKAIADSIEFVLSQKNIELKQKENSANYDWLVLDYIDIVVHIQKPAARNFYALASLWQDCPQISIDSAAVKYEHDTDLLKAELK